MPNTASRRQERSRVVPIGEPSVASNPPAERPDTARPDGVGQEARSDGVEAQDGQALDRDAVANEAYLLYVARGCQDGYDIEDWLSAEEMVRQRQVRPSAE